MKNSVVLAIVVSVIVWAVCLKLLPSVLPEGPFATLISTVLLAIAGGLLARALLLTRGISSAGIHVIGAVIGSILLLFIVSKVAQLFAFPTFRDPDDKEAIVRCTSSGVVFDSGETDEKKNKVKVGKWLTWKIFGEPKTVVKFEFTPKGGSCLGMSPFKKPHDAPTIPDSRETSSRGKIKKDKDDHCYSYKITCTPPVGPPVWLDPIIEVPKRK